MLYKSYMAFIVFEGIDASGKSTLIQLLSKKLKEHGISVLETKEPGGTKIGSRIRKLLLDKNNSELNPLSETLLYYADRKQNIEELIKKGLEQGQWVLSDRYWASTSAYQCGGRGIDEDFVEGLRRKICQNCEPDLWVLLDSKVDLSLKRLSSKNRDRLEAEPQTFHQRVRNYYLKLSKKEPSQWLVLDADQSSEELLKKVWRELQNKKLLKSLL